LFEGRIRWILAALGGLYFVFLCRVLYLQTSEAEVAREDVERRSTREIPLPPRRGSIRDADGRLLAHDEVGFDLLADARGLGAIEWECSNPACGRVTRTYEVDPGEGPADMPPLPAPRPQACPCRKAGPESFVPTYACDRLAVAALLGEEEEALARDIDEARREGWAAARKEAEGRDARWRKLVLRDWLTRPRPVRRGIDRAAAMEVVLNPARYPGLHAEARALRRVDPDLDGATRIVVGRAGPITQDDLEERKAEFEAEGLTGARVFQMSLGRSGIERACDRNLRGAFGRELVRRDVCDRVQGRATLEEVQDGEDVRLTLSARLCAVADGLLKGKRGAIVALDPRTGAVLAVGGSWGTEEGDPFLPFAGLVPGSVLKVLTAITALEGDLAPKAGEVECRGRTNRVMSCDHVHGSPGLEEALAESCNAYFSETARRVGVKPLGDYAGRLGIAKPYPRFELHNEGGTNWTQHWFKAPWTRDDLTNLGIGQGKVMLSPLQVAGLFGAVANGGHPVTPYLVEGNGREPGEPVASPETLRAIRAGLEGTVRFGTAAEAGLARFKVAGKTGTAQVPGKGYNAWFAGYAPAEAPRIVVVVVLEDQQDFGGRTAAPLAAEFLAAWEAREAAR
jgi:cell division protein FtsI/penicillin-binding protein 2